MRELSLRRVLAQKQKAPGSGKSAIKTETKRLQLEMLRIQQGLWHGQGRAIAVFEGFDAAGKGGAIRTLIEHLDPRGVSVHPIGPPTDEEKSNHWLQRFWTRLPRAGTLAIFDRSWYGRVLVERVERLAPPRRIHDAYREIDEFERMLRDHDIHLIKFFLAISRREQLDRFEDRLSDPYKQWKLTEADLRARERWDDYVAAVDKAFSETHTSRCPWRLIPADHKSIARLEVLRETTSALKPFGRWMEHKAATLGRRTLAAELKRLGRRDHKL